jgi:hypothetical protein
MGSSPQAPPDQPNAFQKKELEDLEKQQKIADQQNILTAQQNLGGIQLDWLRQFGQANAVRTAGIGSPFSAVTGGFSTPFLSPQGTPLSTRNI